MEAATKWSIDREPHVTSNMFLAEKQVERVAKKQKVETIEGKPHVTTYLIPEVENDKKPHSKNKNEVAKPEVEVAKVESSECSNEAFDLDKVESSEWWLDDVYDPDLCTAGGQWTEEWSPCNDFDEDEYWASCGQIKISADSGDIDSVTATVI